MSAEVSGSNKPAGNEFKKLGYSIYLRITEDKFDCYCSYVPTDKGTMISRIELANLLAQYNVKFGINQETFEDFAVKAAAGIKLVDVLLASGARPINGSDEYLDITVKPTAPIPTAESLTDTIDMYNVQTFLNVSAGDEIGKIVPAGIGTPGQNITGVPVPAQDGKPMKTIIGRNINKVENSDVLIAATTGKLCQLGDEISVEDVYVVKGDVNFRVGHIDFLGVVDVKGNVNDNFNITAKKGIKISENIGACSIKSDGDITFCGMDGACRGKIFCGGTLRANFIHDAYIESAGDIIIGVELHNCHIRTLGKVIVDKGSIIGGTCIALGGIESKMLGSIQHAKTVLRVGDDYNDLIELEKLDKELAELENPPRDARDLNAAMELRKEILNRSKRALAFSV